VTLLSLLSYAAPYRAELALASLRVRERPDKAEFSLAAGQKKEDSAGGKRAYSTPTLVVYGSVGEFTKGGSGSFADGNMTTRMNAP
jgi:hypothetical protein